VGVGEWRLTQKGINEIHVEVTAAGDSEEEILVAIKRKLNDIVGDRMNIRVFLVEQIRRDPPQKLRSVVSEVADCHDK
jgi:hypothetical protein